MPNRYELYSGS